MSAGTWIARPVHHVLIAAYPVLYLLSNNLSEVDPGEGLAPTAIAVGAALALFVVLRLARVSARRAALVVSIGAVVFLTYGHAARAMEPLRISGWVPLVGWLLIGALLIVAVRVTRSDLHGLTALLNVASAGLIGFALVTILSQLPTTSGLYVGGQRLPIGGQSAGPTPDPSAGQTGATRDIYYLMVEDYGAPRQLSEYWDVPGSGFFDWLAGEGFSVLRDTRSNYGRTPLSVASSMNMTYLDALAAELGPDEPDQGPLGDMVKDSEATAFLKARGYSYVLLGSQYFLTAKSPVADVNPTFAQTSDFIAVLTESTILPSLANLLGFEDDLSDRRRIYDAAVWGLETFPELTELPGPKFVFMHLYLPHSPWVVDEDGAYVTEEMDGERSTTERYRAQWGFVDREMRRLIEGLLDQPEESRPIIILTTDEGPSPGGMPRVEGNIDWTTATDAQLDQKLGIFTAYYLPGVSDDCLYPGMSSVNTFRLVFDLYFDAGLTLLPDRSYMHRDRKHPYDLTDVTDRLPVSSAGSETATTCDG